MRSGRRSIMTVVVRALGSSPKARPSRPVEVEAIAEASGKRLGGRLLGRGHGKAFAAALAARREHFAAAFGAHARAKAVRLLAVAVAGAKRPLHGELTGWKARSRGAAQRRRNLRVRAARVKRATGARVGTGRVGNDALDHRDATLRVGGGVR